MTNYIVEDVEGPPTSGYIVEDVAGPPPSDKSVKGALAKAGENTATSLGALVSEAGKHIGGGKVFPKLMARVAAALHNPDYQSGGETLMDPNATIGERAAGLGRAMIESSPAMVGAVAGPAGIAATSGLLGAGSAIERVRAADNVPADQALNPQQLARVGGSAAIDAAGAFIPAGKALAPIAGQTGKNVVGKALAAGLKDTAEAAGISAASSMAQAEAQKRLLEGQDASAAELLAAGALGGAAAGGARLARVPTQVGEEFRFRQFADQDPAVLAAAANRLKKASGERGIKEGNAEDIRTNALKQAQADMKFEAAGQRLGNRDMVARELNIQAERGNSAPAKAYAEAQAAISKGEAVPADIMTTLEGSLGNHPQGQAWLRHAKEASAIGELGNIGYRQGEGRLGGLHATSGGRTIDWLAQKFGLGSLGIGLAGQAAGLTHPVGQVGMMLGAGTTGMSLGARLLDRMTGYSNPVGTFANRFGDPTTYSAPARGIANTVSGGSSSPPPSGPPAGPAGPSGAPPVVNPLPGRIAAVMNRQPRNLFPEMQGPPSRMPQDNFRGGIPGASGAAQEIPANLPDLLALVRARQALGQDNAPLAQNNVRQFPASPAGQDNAPLLMQDNNGPTMVPPPVPADLPMSRVGVPGAANEGTGSPLEIALLKRMAGPMSQADLEPPMAPPPAPEPPPSSTSNLINQRFEEGNRSMLDRLLAIRAAKRATNEAPAAPPATPEAPEFQTFPQEHGIYDVASPVDQNLLRKNIALQKLINPGKPAPAPKPKEVKLEASVTPMEEAVKQEAPKAKATKAEPGVDKVTGVFNGVEISIPKKDIRVSQAAWERSMTKAASVRKSFTDLIKDSLGAEEGEAFDKLSGHWMNDKTLTNARQRLIKFLDEQKIEGKERKAILDEFEGDEALKKTWKPE